MFNYFTNNHDADVRYPLKKYFKWEVIRKMYSSELTKVKEYYRGREYNYENSNTIVKLIKTLSRDVSMPVLDYLAYIDNDAKYIVKQFDFVSNLNNGKVLSNVLFEGYSKEIFLYVDNAVDPIAMADNWVNYESIKVIKTDLTDINYPVLFRYKKYTPGITVFEIDVKAMMLQYYYWCKARLTADRDIAANIFLPAVIIPNISDSLIDYVIWNRFKAIAFKEPLIDIKMKHPMYLIDYSKGIDDVLTNIVKENTKTSIYLSQLLKTIPAITNRDTYETLQIDKSYYNKQSKWVLWISRLSDITALYMAIGRRGYRLNKDLFNQMPYAIKLMERGESPYEDKLDNYNLTEIKNKIEYLSSELGRR